MIVRIRLRLGSNRASREGSNRNVALAIAALLSPAALVAFALFTWSLLADLGLAGEFGIRDEVFARWQTWLLISLVLQSLALALNRYGSAEGETSMP
jgi:hypothetical protein